MSLNKLCNELNTRVIGYEALEVVDESGTMVIKVKKSVTPKIVNKLFIDDLIRFFLGKAQMTTRLQNYATRLSEGKVVVTRDAIFY